jgi:hypothetical protein
MIFVEFYPDACGQSRKVIHGLFALFHGIFKSYPHYPQK